MQAQPQAERNLQRLRPFFWLNLHVCNSSDKLTCLNCYALFHQKINSQGEWLDISYTERYTHSKERNPILGRETGSRRKGSDGVYGEQGEDHAVRSGSVLCERV